MTRFAEEAGHAAWFFMHTMVYRVKDQASLQVYCVAACAMVDSFPCGACRARAAGNAALQAHLRALREARWDAMTGGQDWLKVWAYQAHLLVSASLEGSETEGHARWRRLNPAAAGTTAQGRRRARAQLIRELDAHYKPAQQGHQQACPPAGALPPPALRL